MKENRYVEVLVDFRNNKDKNLSDINIHNAFATFQRKSILFLPQTVSYYCSEDVAISILEDGFIWLCSIRKMNDSSEMHFSVEHLKNKLRLIENNTKFNLDLIKIIKESYDMLSDNESQEEDIITYNGKLILAMCFSESEDDAAMWDRYGNNGKGVSIKFNVEKLFRMIKTAGLFFPGSSAYEHGIVPICYKTDKCNCLENLYNEVSDAYNQTQNQTEKDIIRTLLHANVLDLLVSHKHPSFSSERELRIFIKALYKKSWIGSDFLFSHTVGDNISCHSKIFLPIQVNNQSIFEFWDELIHSIMLGTNSTIETKERLQNSLIDKKIINKMIKSSCPLMILK